MTTETEPVAQVLTLTFQHRKDIRRTLTAVFRIVGHDVASGEIDNIVWNPHSGHPAAVKFRAKFDLRKYGPLDNWVNTAFHLVEELLPTGSPTKPSVTVTIAEGADRTVKSDIVTATWETRTPVQIVGGEATFRGVGPSAKLSKVEVFWLSAAPLQVQYPGDPLPTEEEQTVRRKDVVLEAVKSSWDDLKYGKHEDYRLYSFNYGATTYPKGRQWLNAKGEPLHNDDGFKPL
jgi:hypothetical protein